MIYFFLKGPNECTDQIPYSWQLNKGNSNNTKSDLFHTVTWKWQSASAAFCQVWAESETQREQTQGTEVKAMIFC